MSDILADLEQFVSDVGSMDPQGAERRIIPILERMLTGEGYSTPLWSEGPYGGWDLHMTRHREEWESEALAVEFKKTLSPVSVSTIDQLLGRSLSMPVNRLMFVSTSGFTSGARQRAQESFPVKLQLFDLDDLCRMAAGSLKPKPPGESSVALILKGVSEEFAKIVARCPQELDNLEWRDLERMMAEVLDGLGFDAELTPASKDGGKDVILRLSDALDGGVHTYIVELKHWRSNKQVGQGVVKRFVEVVAREARGGLILATHGFTSDAFGFLTEIEQLRVSRGGKGKVVNLCRTYARARAGLWNPVGVDLPRLLMEKVAD